MSERWGLATRHLRLVERDGFLPVERGVVRMHDVRTLEEMGLPATWRKRAASSQRPRLTPRLDPETMELPSVESLMRHRGVCRAEAYKILSTMRDSRA